MEIKNFKTIAIILLAVLGVFIIYHFVSSNNATKELKRLRNQLSDNVDSLNAINQRYDSLATNYESIYRELNTTKSQLIDLKSSIDSVMHENIVSVKEIKDEVDHLLEDTLRFKPIEIDPNDNFRFR